MYTTPTTLAAIGGEHIDNLILDYIEHGMKMDVESPY
jgi:hypothetical protein